MMRFVKITSSFVGGGIIGIFVLWIGGTYFQVPSFQVLPRTSVPPLLLATTSTSVIARVDATTTTTQLFLKSATTTPEIQIQPQKVGNTVFINTVVLPENGWVVVHAQKGKFIGEALGMRYEKSGIQKNISIPLLYPTAKGRTYWIVLYTDNGDGQFNPSTDVVVRTITGEPVIKSFIAI